jgi:hypothetical protein
MNKFRLYPIQGMLFGLEWDWDRGWFSINLLIIKIVCFYNVRYPIDETN